MPPTEKKKVIIKYVTRCYVCGVALVVVDDYGDYNKLVTQNGKLVRKSEQRWFDPDWVIQHHITKTH